jgi:hypothetical protein
MVKQIDLAEVRAEMLKYQEATKPDLEKPDFDGAIARICHDIVPELTAWRSREVNRQTEPHMRVRVVTALFASALSTEIKQYIESEDQRLEAANLVIAHFAGTMANLLVHPEEDPVFIPFREAVGNA